MSTKDEKPKNNADQNGGEPKTRKAKALRVHAKPKRGFRRAGFEFSYSKPTTLLLDALKKEQIKALKEEPNLVVEEVTVDAEEITLE